MSERRLRTWFSLSYLNGRDSKRPLVTLRWERKKGDNHVMLKWYYLSHAKDCYLCYSGIKCSHRWPQHLPKEGANPTKGANGGGANPTNGTKGGGALLILHLLIAICTLR